MPEKHITRATTGPAHTVARPAAYSPKPLSHFGEDEPSYSLKPSTRRPDMLPMQRLSAMRAGSRHVASAAPRLSRALKSGTWMDREMKYDT